jgi:chromosomal replication initiator protein
MDALQTAMMRARVVRAVQPAPPPPPKKNTEVDSLKLEVKLLSWKVEALERGLKKIINRYLPLSEGANAGSAEAVNGRPSLKKIIHAVCEKYSVSLTDIVSNRRRKDIVRPRQIIAYLGRKLTLHTYLTISNAVGKSDHSTAAHAWERIGELRLQFPELDNDLRELEAQLMAGCAPDTSDKSRHLEMPSVRP